MKSLPTRQSVSDRQSLSGETTAAYAVLRPAAVKVQQKLPQTAVPLTLQSVSLDGAIEIMLQLGFVALLLVLIDKESGNGSGQGGDNCDGCNEDLHGVFHRYTSILP
jgi:hypothetical protein